MSKEFYHFTSRNNWENAPQTYRTDSIESEGFIHCSFRNQVSKSANKWAKGVDDLVLLVIDPERVQAEIKYENTSGGTEDYPHIYGELNVDAVKEVLPIPQNDEGFHQLPEVLMRNDVRYEWILFDLDSTLLDFKETSKAAFKGALAHVGVETKGHHYVQYNQINSVVWADFEKGKIDTKTLRHRRFELYLKWADLPHLNPKELSELYLQNLIRYSSLWEGARELLDDLHNEVKMAIITNGLQDVQRPRLRNLDLAKYFDTLVISDEIGFAKPDGRYFDYTFEQIGQPEKSKTLVVGDSIGSDIKGGNDYGLDTCWFNPSGGASFDGIKPKYEIKELNALKKIIGVDS